MTAVRRALLGLLLVLAWTRTAQAADGYVFYYTDKGVPLRWYHDDVPVKVDRTLCADLPDADTLAAIMDSLATWNRVDCPHPLFQDPVLVQDVPPFTQVGTGEGGSNLIIFEALEAWMADNPALKQDPNVIALTTLFYDPNTGEIRSYALEMNEEFEFAVLEGPDGPKVDLANTLTHELGHVMALDHSGNRSAAMYYSAGTGEISKRILTQDDTDGVCTLYSEEYADVNPEGSLGGGNGCSTGGPALPLALAPSFLALACLALARRTVRSPRGP